MLTGWCEECQCGWEGEGAHRDAAEHEKETDHVVWYDERKE